MTNSRIFPTLGVCSTLAILAACGGGGSSAPEAIVETVVPNPEPTQTVQTTESLVLPETLQVVSANGSGPATFRQISSKGVMAGVQTLASDAGTDYTLAPQKIHTWVEALEPVEMVNSILCFAGKLKANEFVNEGAYLALVDEGQCFNEEGGETQLGENGQAQSSDSGKTFINAVVNATREDDTSPLIVEAWIKDVAGDGPEGAMSVKMRAVITEGASDDSPFGKFSFSWKMVDTLVGSANEFGGGEILTVDALDGFTGFTLYEENSMGEGEFAFSSEQMASVVMRNDMSDGVALTGYSEASSFFTGGNTFALSFDESNVLVQTAEDFDSLPYKSGENSAGECLSRENFDENVWRYDLFDADSGDRVTINSGFPIRYDSDDDGTFDRHGYVGYHGVWVDGGEGLASGTVVQRETFGDSNSAAQQYTVQSAPGRLVQFQMESLALADARGTDLMYWDDSANSAGYDQWVVRYLTVAEDSADTDGFYKVAGMTFGGQDDTGVASSGPTREELNTPVALTAVNDWDVFNFWSNQLGGQVRYKAGATTLKFYKETVLTGAEADVFGDGDLSLVCLFDCPKGEITDSLLGDWGAENSPLFNPDTMGAAPSYSFSTAGDNSMTLVRTSNSEAVVFADTVTKESLQSANLPWAWGLRSGAMVLPADAALLTNVWDIHDSELVTTYYQWETGFDQWQRQTSLVDNSTGELVGFDRPINFSYRHTDANDRSGDAGSRDGQTFQIHYGGKGDFGGIPHQQNGDRWNPAFSIADGVSMGGDNQYVIKARDIERQMAEDANGCGDLVANDPAAPLPSEVTLVNEMGDMPTVDGAPAVIDGEVQ
ncbi:hypothetical protein [Simiduia aestuariiviva]|uniref:Uncharacterized protein n=1 Tax=Simiduia aestuariiviva TaxID=1510459 RepID=A0A839UQQ1_9GAMM|nr:hypothetical protein [Simiduia aestuariiviva]MBB3169061.1 hypothetical protein [Simiduia aestuariiviva]